MRWLQLHARVRNRREMGKLAFLGLAVSFLATGGTAYGGASGVTLLSENHHVWGFAGESQGSLPTGNVATYDQTGFTPLDVAVGQWPPASDPFPGYAHSVAGDFSVSAQSVYWYSSAWAASEYRFTPAESSLRVRVFGNTDGHFQEGVAQYTLTNTTLGDVLDEFEAIGAVAPDSDLYFDWQKDYAVSPEHEYLLTLYAHSGPSDFFRGTGIAADVTCVPSPSALLLGALGAGLTAWRRRRESREA